MTSRQSKGPAHVLVSFAAALALFGCAEPSERPIGPGGGSLGPNFTPDGTRYARAQGQLCEITSLTDRGACQPLLNSGSRVSTFDSLDDVQDDGTFDVEIKYIDKNGHIAIYVISTDEWVGGAKWVDAEPGEDLYDLEVPVMKRETMEAIVQGSGAEHPPGDGIVALQAASFNGVPLEGVDFGPLEGKEPYHGGPSTFSPGGATSSNGTAVYFGIISGPAGFELEFADSGQDYSLHSVLGHDTFTIARVKLDR